MTEKRALAPLCGLPASRAVSSKIPLCPGPLVCGALPQQPERTQAVSDLHWSPEASSIVASPPPLSSLGGCPCPSSPVLGRCYVSGDNRGRCFGW